MIDHEGQKHQKKEEEDIFFLSIPTILLSSPKKDWTSCVVSVYHLTWVGVISRVILDIKTLQK